MSSTDQASPPLWQQVLVDLERRIDVGDIVDRFPTDRELTEHYGVSRPALDSVWLPLDIGWHLLDVDLTHTALYDELQRRAGVRITAADETIEPLIPDADARALLHLDDDEALLRVRRLGRHGERPVECRITLIRGQRFLYTSSWRADEGSGPTTTFGAG